MQTVFAISRLEIKQQTRSLVFWLVVLFSSFLAFDGYFTSPNLWENMLWAASSLNLVVLLVSLLAAMAAQRSNRQRISEIVDSTASCSFGQIFGQWLGLTIITLLLSLLIVLILTGRALMQGGSFSLATFLLFWLTYYFPNLLLGATLGLTLGAFLPSLFISLPLTVAWWFGISGLADSGALPRLLPGIWADIVDFTATTPTVSSAAFGFLPSYRYLLNRSAQLGLILTILAILTLFYKRRRENIFSKQAVSIALVALLTLGGSIAGFTNDMQAIQTGYFQRWVPEGSNGLAAHLERAAWENKLLASPLPTVLGYELDLRLSPEARKLSASVKMQLKSNWHYPNPWIIFTLDQKLQIESVKWQGQPMEVVESSGFGWRRADLQHPHWLLPGEAGLLEIEYSGEIWEWTSRWNERDPELMSFISKQGAFLAPHLCYYPVLGLQNIRPSIRDYVKMPDYPVDFRLKVSGTDLPVVSNLPEQAPGVFAGRLPALFVAAGNWVKLETENITLWHSKDHQLDEYVEALQNAYDLATTYLGQLPEERITAVTVPSWFYGDLDHRATQTILIGDRKLSFDRRIGQLLWQHQSILSNVVSCWHDTLHDFPPSLTAEQRAEKERLLAKTSYLWSLYRESLPGQAGSLQAEYEARALAAKNNDFGGRPELDAGQLYNAYSAELNRLWLEFEEVRSREGSARLQEILQK